MLLKHLSKSAGRKTEPANEDFLAGWVLPGGGGVAPAPYTYLTYKPSRYSIEPVNTIIRAAIQRLIN